MKMLPKTIGESNDFEDRIRTTSEIVKIHWKYVSFLTTPNRNVRESMGFMQRAERCKIKEIGLKLELLKSIGNMCISWPSGSKSIENADVF